MKQQDTITIEKLVEILRNHIGQINAKDIGSYDDYYCNISICTITNGEIDAMLLNLGDDDKKTLIDGLNGCFDELNKHADEEQAYFESLGWDVGSCWEIIDIKYDSDMELLQLVLTGEPIEESDSDWDEPLFDDELMTEVMYKVRSGLEGLKIQTDEDGDTYVVLDMDIFDNDDEKEYFRYAFDYVSESNTSELGLYNLTADQRYVPDSLPLCGCRFGQHDEYIVDIHKTYWTDFVYKGKLYVKLPDEDDAAYGKAVIYPDDVECYRIGVFNYNIQTIPYIS